MSHYPKLIILFLFILVVFLTHGCYTAFTHPPVNENGWGEVYVSDDCLECHDTDRYSTTVLPESAQDDFNWQFYSGSAWWQDEETINTSVAPEPSGTGPRNVSYTPQSAAPVAMPVQGGGSLGKTNASEQDTDNQQKSTPQRSVGRRSHTTSSSSQESSPTRSRKR